MSKNIAVNNSLAKDHAERIRMEAAKIGEISFDRYTGQVDAGYTALTDVKRCYAELNAVAPRLQHKLEQDCANIARVADVWKQEDKEVATHLTIAFEDIGNSKEKYKRGTNICQVETK